MSLSSKANRCASRYGDAHSACAVAGRPASMRRTACARVPHLEAAAGRGARRSSRRLAMRACRSRAAAACGTRPLLKCPHTACTAAANPAAFAILRSCDSRSAPAPAGAAAARAARRRRARPQRPAAASRTRARAPGRSRRGTAPASAGTARPGRRCGCRAGPPRAPRRARTPPGSTPAHVRVARQGWCYLPTQSNCRAAQARAGRGGARAGRAAAPAGTRGRLPARPAACRVRASAPLACLRMRGAAARCRGRAGSSIPASIPQGTVLLPDPPGRPSQGPRSAGPARRSVPSTQGGGPGGAPRRGRARLRADVGGAAQQRMVARAHAEQQVLAVQELHLRARAPPLAPGRRRSPPAAAARCAAARRARSAGATRSVRSRRRAPTPARGPLRADPLERRCALLRPWQRHRLTVNPSLPCHCHSSAVVSLLTLRYPEQPYHHAAGARARAPSTSPGWRTSQSRRRSGAARPSAGPRVRAPGTGTPARGA